MTTRLPLALLALAAALLPLAGCQNLSSDRPFQLTGENETDLRATQDLYVDTKNHYHPEWRMGINTPTQLFPHWYHDVTVDKYPEVLPEPPLRD